MILNCPECDKEFIPPQKELNRGNGKVCSKACGRKRARKVQLNAAKKARIVVFCAYCKKKFTKTASKAKGAKHSIYFCCREHKDLGQRIGYIKEIQPAHYSNVAKDYRTTAFRGRPNICRKCGYDKIIAVLCVHHIDRDRENNNLDNLEILCPTCHEEEHFIAKDGRWTRSK